MANIPVDGGIWTGLTHAGAPWPNDQAFADAQGWVQQLVANVQARQAAGLQATPGATPGIGWSAGSSLPFGQRPSPGPIVPVAIDHGGQYATAWAAQVAGDYAWAWQGHGAPRDHMGAPPIANPGGRGPKPPYLLGPPITPAPPSPRLLGPPITPGTGGHLPSAPGTPQGPGYFQPLGAPITDPSRF
jgi:hypothetical protein